MAFALCGAVGAVLVYLTAKRTFQSEARLMVRYVTESSLLTGEGTGDRVISPNLRGQSIINSEAEIFSSLGIAETVAKAVGPRTITDSGRDSMRLNRWGLRLPKGLFSKDGDAPADAGFAAMLIQDSLTIEVPNRSNVIKLYYAAPTPTLAQDVLSRLIDAYLQKHYEVHRGGDAYEFLAQQTDQLKARLHETENELRRRRQEAGVISTEESKSALSLAIEDLRKQLRDSELALAEAKAGHLPSDTIPKREEETAEQPKRSTGSQAELEALCANLVSLRERERQLLATYTRDSTPVRNVRQQITELEQRIARDYPGAMLIDMPGATQDSRVSVVQQQTARRAALEAKTAALSKQLQETIEEAKRVDDLETEIRQLERKKELEENNYLYFSRSLEKARIDDALSLSKVSNISIVQKATLPVLPLGAHTLHKMLLVMILAVGAGVGLAFVSELMADQAMRDPATTREILNRPVLTVVPFVPRRVAGLFPRKRGKARLLPALAKEEAPSVQKTLWEVHYEHSAYFEDVRNSLVDASSRVKGQTYLVGVASGSTRTATTSVAAELALFLARNGKSRVLLIDAEFDEAGIRGLSESRPAHARVEPLARGSETAEQSNLFLLVIPPVKADMSQTSTAQALSDLIDESRGTSYDFIVYHVPALREMSPSLRFAGRMDSVIVVVDADRERSDELRRTRQRLKESDATVLGSVLIRRS